MAASLFIGFSTQVLTSRSGWSLTNVELIKRDLLNEFFTKKGERVMLPNYGTIIWDLLFEPFTDAVQSSIVDDVKRIVGHDSRVSLMAMDVATSDHGIMVSMDLKYLPFTSVGSFALAFDRRALESA